MKSCSSTWQLYMYVKVCINIYIYENIYKYIHYKLMIHLKPLNIDIPPSPYEVSIFIWKSANCIWNTVPIPLT